MVAQDARLVRRHHSDGGAFSDQNSSVGTEDGLQAIAVRSDSILENVRTSPEEYKATEFKLLSQVGNQNLRIPNQVILTGHFANYEAVLQHRAELTASLGITPEQHVRYFNNGACRTYLEKYDPDLVPYFDSETHGSYQGDLCRTAVLAREGGFYVDLDMQLRVPLHSLVDDETTFMTARAAYGAGALNAIIATVPDSPVMRGVLASMRKWYRNEIPKAQNILLGPETMRMGLEDAMKESCPEQSWANSFNQFKCGKEHSFRLFTEQLIADGNCDKWMPTMCPKARAVSPFQGVKFGLFDGRKDGMEKIANPSAQDIMAREQRFIGWPRYDGCTTYGCNLNGGIPSLLDSEHATGVNKTSE